MRAPRLETVKTYQFQCPYVSVFVIYETNKSVVVPVYIPVSVLHTLMDANKAFDLMQEQILAHLEKTANSDNKNSSFVDIKREQALQFVTLMQQRLLTLVEKHELKPSALWAARVPSQFEFWHDTVLIDPRDSALIKRHMKTGSNPMAELVEMLRYSPLLGTEVEIAKTHFEKAAQ